MPRLRVAAQIRARNNDHLFGTTTHWCRGILIEERSRGHRNYLRQSAITARTQSALARGLVSDVPESPQKLIKAVHLVTGALEVG